MEDDSLTLDLSNTFSNVTFTSSISAPTDMNSITDTLNNVTMSSPYTVTGAIGTGSIYTTATGTAAPWATFNPNRTGAKINLTGDEADIEVNGWSLVQAVKRIEERLDLFQPNPELEQEWEELKQLGEQYRKLEQYIKDKQATFDRLKSMPAPEID
jgi:hypothetical protein